jgi:hypothetical protein
MVARAPSHSFVIPAKAGTHGVARDIAAAWVPAFAGMTRDKATR